MDKRTFLFVIGLSLLFFAIHQFFDVMRGGGAASNLTGPKSTIEFTGKSGAQPVASDEEKSLNLVPLYNDVELKDFAAYAIQLEASYLVIAWEDSLPNEIYVKSSNERVALTQKLTLKIKPQKKEDPALYSLYSSTTFKIPYIPHEGTHNVTVVYFDGKVPYKVNGKIEAFDRLTLDQKPLSNGYIYFDYDVYSVPYAFYNVHTNKVVYLDHLPKFEDSAVLTYPETETLVKEYRDQQFFVIENGYQQLVFTNLNGALAEINLPFKTEKNPLSVVREIEFDRIIQSRYPFNDSYPQFPYLVANQENKIDPQSGGYYPLLRRNVMGKAGYSPTTQLNPHYYALSILESESIIGAELYKIKRFEKDLIEFELVDQGKRITKTYSLPKDSDLAPYCFDLTVRVEGDARGLLLTSGVPEVELISGSFSPSIKYRVTRNQKSSVEEISLPKELVTYNSVSPDWVCNDNGFFGIILDPQFKNPPGFEANPVSGDLTPTRLSIIDAQHNRFPTTDYPGYNILWPIPSVQGVYKYRIFAGPLDKAILERVDQTYSNPETGYTPEYIDSQSYHGWFAFISQPFAKFLFILMSFFYSVTHSWGFSIILLTFALRLMLYPLNNWSFKSNIKMQMIAPKVTALQEKYKKDKKRSQMEIMNLYRKEGVNPFGGCLPLLIQLPFLFGMFDLLKSSFSLRGASFIPGWIDDLTAPDVLFTWKYPLPFFGNAFHFLPILLGLIMYFQQKITSRAKADAPMTDQMKQQKFTGNLMTIVFTVLFYHFQSGLNIYWIFSTLLGMLQQWWINKRMLAKQDLQNRVLKN